MTEPLLPVGFQEFWKETTEEAFAYPLDYSLKAQNEYSSAGHEIQLLKFLSVNGSTMHGWVAQPFVDQVVPGFLWIPPYSRWSMLPNAYGVREGFASLSWNFFGETAFHREEYTPARGYFAEGCESPQTWVFRRMFQDAVLAYRIFSELPGVDAKRIGSAGMSQGGGISVWLGAWVKGVKAVVADMPFLGAMEEFVFNNSIFRYPLKELTDVLYSSPENEVLVKKTVSYFDTWHQATFCEKPTRVTLGLRDPAVKPGQAKSIYQALPGEKELEEIDWGHDWHERMILGGDAWMKKHL